MKIASWCVDKYEQYQRVIQLQGESPFSLSPSVFRRMLKLPKPTIIFKGEEAKRLLNERNYELELLREYLEDPAMMPKDLLNI
jgi:hypothetical protein